MLIMITGTDYVFLPLSPPLEQVIGECLLSGGDDGIVRVWRAKAGAPSGWTCDHTLVAHRRAVRCLTVWGERAVSGSSDQTLRIWPASVWAVTAADGEHLAGGGEVSAAAAPSAAAAAEAGDDVETLWGHLGPVYAVAAASHRLVSAAADGVVRVWAENAAPSGGSSGRGVTCVAVMQACPVGSGHYVRSLAVSGRRIVAGCDDGVMLVWDMDAVLAEDGRGWGMGLRVGGNRVAVRGLVADGGEVWGCVGVVWGGFPRV